MRICFLGKSYAALTLKEGARRRGLKIMEDVNRASLIFVSEDTPTDENGVRDLAPIKAMIESCDTIPVPLVLTSQVPPGFSRKMGVSYHQAETLRIEDGLQRAMYPEMFIVGTSGDEWLHPEYLEYLHAFECPIIKMTFEEAEFCKMAINHTLISQVNNTNYLSGIAEKWSLDWGKISKALRHDSRIGKYSYLTPGDWTKSKHLFRDFVTLNELA